MYPIGLIVIPYGFENKGVLLKGTTTHGIARGDNYSCQTPTVGITTHRNNYSATLGEGGDITTESNIDWCCPYALTFVREETLYYSVLFKLHTILYFQNTNTSSIVDR